MTANFFSSTNTDMVFPFRVPVSDLSAWQVRQSPFSCASTPEQRAEHNHEDDQQGQPESATVSCHPRI